MRSVNPLCVLTLFRAQTPLSPAVMRIAQGAVENVDIAFVPSEDQALATLKKLKQLGCKIITTTSHFDGLLYRLNLNMLI